MSNTNTGGPAFPAEVWSSDGVPEHSEGMTLRDYFAAKAMQIAYAHFSRDLEREEGGYDVEWDVDIELWAERSYELADAMLRARDAK